MSVCCFAVLRAFYKICNLNKYCFWLQVADAVARGARLLCGGTRLPRDGSWYPATVLADCTPDMLVTTQETYEYLTRVFHDCFDDEHVNIFSELRASMHVLIHLRVFLCLQYACMCVYACFVTFIFIVRVLC